MGKNGLKRGFTLFEIIGVMLVLAITFGVSFVALRSPRRTSSPDSAARVLFSVLQSAQSEARAKDMPIGVALASDGQEAATGVYILEGHVMPKITKTIDFQNDFEGTYVTQGVWGGTPSTAQPDTGDGFLIDAWSPPRSKDPILVFLPSGRVVSNGLAHIEGEYRLVVGTAFALSPTKTLGTAPSYVLSGALDPSTITVSQSGEIDFYNGWPSGFALREAGSKPSLGSMPARSLPSSQSPEIISVNANPTQSTGTKAPLNGGLNFTVDAWSPEGEALYAEWSGEGDFSSTGPVPLEWHPLEAVWRGNIEWKVPKGLTEGDSVELSVKVSDRFGNAVVSGSNKIEAIKIEISRPVGKVVYRVTDSVEQIKDDGTDKRTLFTEDFEQPRWSPDGTKLVGIHRGTGSTPDTLVMAHPGAGTVKTLASTGSSISEIKWAPNGMRVSFLSHVDGQTELFVVGADGSGLTQVTPKDNKRAYAGYNWSPDGQRLVYGERTGNKISSQRIFTVDVDGGSPDMLIDREAQWPVWAGGEDRIIFWERETGTKIMSMDPDGGNLTTEIDLDGIVSGYWWSTGTTLGLSADRRYISFEASASGTRSQGIHCYDRVSKKLVTVPNSTRPTSTMGLWSPDPNNELVLVKNSGNNSTSDGGLSVSAPDGTDTVVLTTSYTSDPDWAR